MLLPAAVLPSATLVVIAPTPPGHDQQWRMRATTGRRRSTRREEEEGMEGDEGRVLEPCESPRSSQLVGDRRQSLVA